MQLCAAEEYDIGFRSAWLSLTASLNQVVPVQAYPFKPLPAQPGFSGGLVLGGAAIEYSSPALADLNGDGMQEIVVAVGAPT